MKVGVMAVVFGRVKGMSVMKTFAAQAERLGISTLWAPEHVILMRYRDAGVEEFVVTGIRAPHTPEEAQAVLEKAAHDRLEPAARL